MQIEIINPNEYLTSYWDGGTTTQLYILPTGLTVQEDFVFRISSATVQKGSSTFTDFHEYNRFLTVLHGKMFVKHDEAQEKCLNTFDTTFFDGSAQTVSRCDEDIVDFNIIWKKTMPTPNIYIVQTAKQFVVTGTVFFYSCCDQTLIKIQGQEQLLNKGQLIKLTGRNLSLEIQGSGVYCAVNI